MLESSQVGTLLQLQMILWLRNDKSLDAAEQSSWPDGEEDQPLTTARTRHPPPFPSSSHSPGSRRHILMPGPKDLSGNRSHSVSPQLKYCSGSLLPSGSNSSLCGVLHLPPPPATPHLVTPLDLQVPNPCTHLPSCPLPSAWNTLHFLHVAYSYPPSFLKKKKKLRVIQTEIAWSTYEEFREKLFKTSILDSPIPESSSVPLQKQPQLAPTVPAFLFFSFFFWYLFILLPQILVTGLRLSYFEACGILVTGPGIKPRCPALQDRFLITGPVGKSLLVFLYGLTIYAYIP